VGEAIIAQVYWQNLNASLLEIYTDVKGVYTADPQIIDSAQLISNICFEDMAELSKYGAKVLHPDTLLPCERMNIPIMIKSTFTPEEGGTLIESKSQVRPGSFSKAVAIRDNQVLLTVKKSKDLTIENIINSLSQYKVSVDIVSTSRTDYKLLIDKSDTSTFGKNHKYDFLNELTITSIKDDLSRLTIIGKSVLKLTKALQRFIESTNIPVLIISNREGFPNFSLLIQNKYVKSLITKLHNILIES